MDMWENNLPYKAHICELPFSEKKVKFLSCKHLQWRPIQMIAFHSNENGLFCTSFLVQGKRQAGSSHLNEKFSFE